MEKPHQIEVTHESHYVALRNPDQSQAIALAGMLHPLALLPSTSDGRVAAPGIAFIFFAMLRP
jgi:hypothetical protein